MRNAYRSMLIVGLTLALLVAGCAGAKQEAMDYAESEVSVIREEMAVEAPMAATAAAMPREQSFEKDEAGFGAAASAVANVDERMIIRTVSMSVVVEDTDVMLVEIQNLVKANGGYVAASNRWLSGEQAYASVTLRVPADKLEAVLGVLRDNAITVENESSSGDDVTEEYVDISARLRNLEATEEELLALLTEVRKNRGSAEDILAIHNRITQLRSEIESLKGRQQYLERSAALATVNIEIRPKRQPGTIVEPARWNPAVTVNNALRGLVEAGQVAIDVLIWLVFLSPIFLIPILVLWLIIRAIKRARARRKAKHAAEPTEPGNDTPAS